MRRYVVLLLVLLLPLLLGTTIYRWTDEQGRPHFSDTPQEGAVEVQIGEPSVIDITPPATTTRAEAAPASASQATYARFDLVAPADQLTLRDNTGQVPVIVSIDPALRPGHTIRISLNGRPYGEQPYTRSTSFTLNGIDRGEHRLELTLVDAGGNVLARAASTFYLHQASRLATPPQRNQKQN